MTLKRKTDGERLALVEQKSEDNRQDVADIMKELKAILRNQWLTAGALAALMFMMNYPQVIKILAPTDAVAHAAKTH